MQVFSESFDVNFNNLQKQNQVIRNDQLIAGNNFQKVLHNHLSGLPVESAMSSTNAEIKRRKKDSEEILEDFSEIAEDTYDVLTAERKIRQLFRKLRLGETDVNQ
ncbi:MAG: hypothetical protein PHF25_00300 [Candidatus Margulisbacteria bacterium]|nr:hypothetical protein [Candidatus Margulisiibacteriota bacterium]